MFCMKFVTFEKNYAMIRSIIIIAILISVQTVSVAQDLTSIDSYIDRLRWDNAGISPNHISYKNVEGTPYYDDFFRKGVLHMKSGRLLSGEFRYDIYADVIEFRKDENIYALAIPDSVARIEVENVIYRYLPYLVKSETNKGYFIILADGHYSLLEKQIKLFRDAKPPGPYQDAPIPARFDDGGTELYIKRGNDPAVKITNNRDIITFCGEDGSIARDYISKNNIRFRDIENLKNLVSHLNERANR